MNKLIYRVTLSDERCVFCKDNGQDGEFHHYICLKCVKDSWIEDMFPLTKTIIKTNCDRCNVGMLQEFQEELLHKKTVTFCMNCIRILGLE